MEALGKIAAQEDEIVRLRARISRLEARLKVEVRNAREAPFGENTPSSKLNFKKDSDEAARVRQAVLTDRVRCECNASLNSGV